MAMNVGGGKGGAKADINVTPLIDVVLVLLIIFMVLVPAMMKHHTANVPKKMPDDVPAPPPSNNIVIEYTADRQISVNAEPVAWEALADKLSDKLKNRGKKLVFFKIEDAANYGEAVKLFDTARGAGAEILGIITPD
jgi:biopolymer transport protein TolR